jgi:hypothetical protein
VDGGLIQPGTAIHTSERRGAIEGELATAPEEVRARIRWPPIGVAAELDV